MIYNKHLLISLLGILFLFSNCSEKENEKETILPILGNWHVDTFEMEGKTVTDTVYHKIAAFTFVNQDSVSITNADMEGKVYVADFFFTTCPTICPIMKTQMLRVYEKFKEDPNFKILSHTIDPKHDTVALLKDYSQRIGVENASTWHFLTGDQ